MIAKSAVLAREEESCKRWRRKNVDVRDEKVFEEEQKPLFKTQAPSRHQKSSWSKRLSHILVVKQAVHLWRKRPSLSKPIEDVDYDALAKVNTTLPMWKNLMSTIQCFCKKNKYARRGKRRLGSGFSCV